MAKRIWFAQQHRFHYVPLRWGLGYDVPETGKTLLYIDSSKVQELCPKIYTTRTRPLQGEYVVVEGSRFKAKPVEPVIRFRAACWGKLWLKFPNGRIDTAISGFRDSVSLDGNWYDGYSFPELDLGIRRSSFSQLRAELLRSYPKATTDTPFYVSRLEPL